MKRSIWRRVKDRVRPQAEKKSIVLGLNDELARLVMFGSGSAGATPASAIELYEKSTAVSIPINIITQAFASLQPVLEFGDKIITEHPVLELLRNPSPYFTQTLFFEALAVDYLVTGETDLVALGGLNRPPLELQPISPKNITVVEGAGGLAGQFDISGNTLNGQYLPERDGTRVRYIDGALRELKQIRSFSTKNNSLLRGQSRLVSASAEARQHILGNTHNVSLLEKGGRVSLVFHFEEDLDTDDFNEVKRRVREQYGGAENAGEIGVTAGGKMKIEQVGTSNLDMDFAELQKMAKEAVSLQYNVPLPLVTNDAQTFNNYKEAKLALYDDAALPLGDRIYGGLSDFLLPRYNLDPAKYRITYDIDSITALALRRNEELTLRKKLNVESDNELRSMIGREPYDGGDVILKPANLIPAGSDLFTDDNTPKVLRDE